MTRFGSIAMFAWGILSVFGSLSLWIPATNPNHELLAAVVATMATIAIGFGFVLEAIIELGNVFRNASVGR
jgi:cytochrome c biogenesis protein CcdA